MYFVQRDSLIEARSRSHRFHRRVRWRPRLEFDHAHGACGVEDFVGRKVQIHRRSVLLNVGPTASGEFPFAQQLDPRSDLYSFRFIVGRKVQIHRRSVLLNVGPTASGDFPFAQQLDPRSDLYSFRFIVGRKVQIHRRSVLLNVGPTASDESPFAQQFDPRSDLYSLGIVLYECRHPGSGWHGLIDPRLKAHRGNKLAPLFCGWDIPRSAVLFR
jgi:hypothetical protein